MPYAVDKYDRRTAVENPVVVEDDEIAYRPRDCQSCILAIDEIDESGISRAA